MLMTPLCQCLLRAPARPGRADSGPMFGMIGLEARPLLRQPGSPIRPTVRESGRVNISASSAARCRPMATLASTTSMKVAGSRKPHVGRTSDASSTTCMWLTAPLAAAAIERIAQLYKIEADIRGKPAECRCEVRQLQARPLLVELHAWMEKTLSSVARKSEIALAIRYALARWRALLRYVDDGTIEIDNSAAERALRVVALGRKNYLFARLDNGGGRAAALYTLLGTAKLNGLDPERYLRQVLERIADNPIQRLHELLPWNMPDAAVLSTDS